MIETADLLDMERELDRRGFVRRLFAIGAGIAASGALVRAADKVAALDDPHMWFLQAAKRPANGKIINLTDWDALLDSDYVRTQLVDAVNHAAPFIEVMRSKLPPTIRVVSHYEALRIDRS